MKIKKDIALSDSGFVFNPSSGESFSTNDMGVELLNLLKKGNSFSEIRNIVLQKYDVNAATFEKDYQDFVSMLEYNNLLESNNNE